MQSTNPSILGGGLAAWGRLSLRGLATLAVAASAILVGPVGSVPVAGAAVGPVKIMPLGNSLTQGIEFDGGFVGSAQQAGYRERLEDRFDEVGFEFDFIGTKISGGARLDDTNHEGVSGETINQIRSRMNGLSTSLDPDVVLLIGGTNDLTDEPLPEDSNDAVAEMSDLIDDLTTKWPGAEVLVSTLPQFRESRPSSRNDLILVYNAALPGIVAAAGSNVSLVDSYPVITTFDIPAGDAVHPDRFGYGKIADVWFDGLVDRFPELVPLEADPLVEDDFNRPNADLGTALTGQSWVENADNAFNPLEWEIRSNKAAVVGGEDEGIVAVDAGITNADVSADIEVSPTAGNPSLTLRAADADNQLVAGVVWRAGNNRLTLAKIDDGVASTLANEGFFFPDTDGDGMSEGPSGTYNLRATVEGSAVEVWFDGVRWISYDLTAAEQTKYGANTIFGLRAAEPGEDGGSRWDNFVLRDPSLPPLSVPEAPTGVTGTAGNGEVVVSWAAPASDGGSAITGYTATAAPGGATCAATVATTCTVTGLANGTGYTFTVTATNAIGTGTASAPSEAVTPVTPEMAPSAPTGVTGVPGDGEVVVSWAAPASDGGSAITGYTATAAPGGATCAATVATTCTVTGLANGTGYTFTVTATNAAGTGLVSSASVPVTPMPAGYTAVGPDRAADTRLNGGERVAAGGTLPISVGTEYAGKSISVNLTVPGALARGFATLYACDQDQPATSSLNYQAGQSIANGVITKVSAQGTVCVFVNQSAHVVLDVFGVFPSDSALSPVGPDRAADTRLNGGERVAAGGTLTIPVGTEYAGKSISVNLTVPGALARGFATLYACDQDQPATSSLNYQAGQSIANGVITKVSAEGTVCVFVNQSAHVVLDVFGVFPSDSALSPVGPDRAADTRLNGGERVAAGGTLPISVGTEYAGKSISVNLTVPGALARGFATLYACDQDQPATSSLNYQAGQSIANGVITKVSAQGTVCVFVNQSAHVVLDVFGVFPT